MSQEQTHEIVILGAGYAGLMAALRLSRKTKKLNVSITLVNASDKFVERIRLHQVVTGQKVKFRSIEGLLKGKNVTFVQGYIHGIDLKAQTVTLETSEGEHQLHFDKLIYALGSHVNRQAVPGVDDFAHTLDKAYATRLASRLQEAAVKRGNVVVIGGGLTAIEGASEIAETYPDLTVQLVTRGLLGAEESDKARAYIYQVMQDLKITLWENSPVREVKADHVVMADGTTLPFDVCLYAGGFAVAPLAKEAGLAVNGVGQILTDHTLASISHPNVVAVGDAANFAPQVGISVRMSCQIAVPMGAHAADSLAKTLDGQTAEPFEFAYTAHCISLGRRAGLFQGANPDDTASNVVIKGRMGVFIKELICRSTVWSLLSEKHLGAFVWNKGIKAKEVSRQTFGYEV